MSIQSILLKFINELVRETGSTPTAITLSQEQGSKLEWELAERMMPPPRGVQHLVFNHSHGEVRILYAENQQEYLDNRMGALMRGEICS